MEIYNIFFRSVDQIFLMALFENVKSNFTKYFLDSLLLIVLLIQTKISIIILCSWLLEKFEDNLNLKFVLTH